MRVLAELVRHGIRQRFLPRIPAQEDLVRREIAQRRRAESSRVMEERGVEDVMKRVASDIYADDSVLLEFHEGDDLWPEHKYVLQFGLEKGPFKNGRGEEFMWWSRGVMVVASGKDKDRTGGDKDRVTVLNITDSFYSRQASKRSDEKLRAYFEAERKFSWSPRERFEEKKRLYKKIDEKYSYLPPKDLTFDDAIPLEERVRFAVNWALSRPDQRYGEKGINTYPHLVERPGVRYIPFDKIPDVV